MTAATDSRPFRDLCPEADMRDAMSDGEFWGHVFSLDGPEPAEPDWDGLGAYTGEEPDISQPCEVCGSTGACSFDEEGRPMIHATPAEGDGDDAD